LAADVKICRHTASAKRLNFLSFAIADGLRHPIVDGVRVKIEQTDEVLISVDLSDPENRSCLPDGPHP